MEHSCGFRGPVQPPTWSCPCCTRAALVAKLTTKAELHGWSVISIPELVSEDWEMRHSCGIVHRLRAYDIGKGEGATGDGCPVCADYGYNAGRPGYVYLLDIPEHGALKIGITNVPEQRMRQHEVNFGLSVIHCWGPMAGSIPRRVESAIKAQWSIHGPAASLVGVPGHTETVPSNRVDLPDVLRSIEHLVAQERKSFKAADYTVASCERAEAEALMVGHYTGTLPIASTLLFGLRRHGSLVGVAAFGQPSYPGVAKSVWPDGDGRGVVELRRLYLLDEVGANAESWFLSRSLRLLPADLQVVVAFSDPSAGHHGAVYQAANFYYLGVTTPSRHYLTADGTYVHKRTPWEIAKALYPDEHPVPEERVALERDLTMVEDAAKHRYAYPLSRKARKVLSAVALGFPKPDLG